MASKLCQRTCVKVTRVYDRLELTRFYNQSVQWVKISVV